MQGWRSRRQLEERIVRPLNMGFCMAEFGIPALNSPHFQKLVQPGTNESSAFGR